MGTYGDHSDWVRKSNIELYACEQDLIVVMPSGLNADYVNWPTFATGFNMYDFLFDELMPLVYQLVPGLRQARRQFHRRAFHGWRGRLRLCAQPSGKICGRSRAFGLSVGYGTAGQC